MSEHARDESRFAFTLHGFLNQRDVADERFRWIDFSFLFSFFTFLFAPGVHLVHLVHLLLPFLWLLLLRLLRLLLEHFDGYEYEEL